jgi:diguanylate cyclase (GGDEF)-like protein
MKSVSITKYPRIFKNVGNVFSSHRDFHTVATKLHKVLAGALGIKNFYICLYNREKNVGGFEFYVHDGKEKKKHAHTFAHAFADYVVKTKKPLHIEENVRACCKTLRIKSTLIPKSVKSWLGVPIVLRNAVEGVVAFQDTKNEHAYSQYDEMLLLSIASHCALFIDNARLFQENQLFALTDPLIDIASRRYFDLVVDREMKRAVGFSRSLSIAMITPDVFKKIVAEHAPHVVTKLFLHIARLIKMDIRDTDFFARYADDTLILIFPETTNIGALTVSERIRSVIEKTRVPIKDFKKKQITVSIGVAAYPTHAETLPELIKCVSRALEQARQLGNSLVESV